MNKEQVLGIVKKNKWSFQQFHGVPFYLNSAATVSGWMQDPPFVNYSHFFYFFTDGRAIMYYDEADWRKIYESFRGAIKTKKELQKLADDYRIGYEITYKKAQYSLGELSSTDKQGVLDITSRILHSLEESGRISHAIEGITFGAEERLRQLLEEKNSFDQMLFSDLCSPTHPSFIAKSQELLWRIAGADGENQVTLIEEFLDKFSWIENNYLGAKTFTVEEIKKRASDIKKEPVFLMIDSARKSEIIKEHNLSDEVQFLVDAIEVCFKWQDDRKGNIFRSIELIGPVFQRISELFNVSIEDTQFMGPQEFNLEFLNASTCGDILHERRVGSAYYETAKGEIIFTGDEFRFLLDALEMKFEEDVKEIMGSVASKGSVTGRVRVVRSVSDIDRVEEGEILIASMTRPEYISAMHRAAAFVTDEGGITCHAAIVSREMGKPCIIGTKTATSVLEDGMEVEVDAEKGIVRILND